MLVVQKSRKNYLGTVYQVILYISVLNVPNNHIASGKSIPLMRIIYFWPRTQVM
jgi:hypothetical protein